MQKYIVSVLLMVGFVYYNYGNPVVGSNTTSSRQFKTFFSSSDLNNKMVGFSVFENGLTLEDRFTNCYFDAFFPISGNVVLNGGTLTLLKDLEFKNPLQICTGLIDGDSFSIEFPGNISSFDIPTKNHTKLLRKIFESDVEDNVNSVDWSYDDKYVAIAIDTASGLSELQIYYVQDESITLTASYNLGNYNVYTVAWHPSEYYLATGMSGGVDLQLFEWNVANGAIVNTDSANTGAVTAVAWNPDGNYLAVGGSNSTTVAIYQVSDGQLGSFYTGNIDGSKSIQKNALSWDRTSSYVAIGLSRHSSGAEVQTFHFDGASIVAHGTINFDATVFAVAWHPSLDVLAVGHSVKTDRLRLYDYDTSTGLFSEQTTARTGEKKYVFGLDWSSDGCHIAAAIDGGSANHEVIVLAYNGTEKVLSNVSGATCEKDAKTVRWSHNGVYLAAGDIADYFKVFVFEEQPLIFNNAKLFFNSDVNVTGKMKFKGSCIINGGGHVLDFENSPGIVVEAGGNLVIEQAIVKNISGTKMRCNDASGVITLRDLTWIQDNDYTFTTGAFIFKNDVAMVGNYIFAYQSKETSTLLSKSNLELDVGFTFSYDPIVENKELIEFVDDTSTVVLNGATLHTTVTGWQLTHGKIFVERDSFISSEQEINDNIITKDEGITFGNNEISNDCRIEISSGATLYCLQGSMKYRNVENSAWKMHTNSSRLYLYPETSLNLYESLNLGEGITILGNNSTLGHILGKKLTGSIHPLGKYINTVIPENDEPGLFD